MKQPRDPPDHLENGRERSRTKSMQNASMKAMSEYARRRAANGGKQLTL